ncbi:MAG: phosphoglycerate dehydrogenase [Solirubrobacteraceae bacterium]
MSVSDAVVLVTPRSFRGAEGEAVARLEAAVAEVRYNDLGRPLTGPELAERLDGVAGLLAGVDEIDAGVFEAAPDLRVIARYGVGVDRVDLGAAARHGVTVTTTPGANAAAVAELTLGLMLALCRKLSRADREVRAGGWPALKGRELGSRTVGLLGLGRIGLSVAALLRSLGATVLAHDPYVNSLDAAQAGIRMVGREELLMASEILSLHTPATPETRGMVDREFLAALRDGALLVNTARGELIDEGALLWALDDGPLAGAALDALKEEPPAPGHPLVGRDDVLVTPHLGGQTAEATAAMARLAVEELLAVLDGRTPRFPALA